MAMTNAEKQAAFRQRRDARITELEAENERLRNQGGGAEIAELRRELAQDRQTLEWALDAIKLLKAQNKRLARGETYRSCFGWRSRQENRLRTDRLRRRFPPPSSG